METCSRTGTSIAESSGNKVNNYKLFKKKKKSTFVKKKRKILDNIYPCLNTILFRCLLSKGATLKQVDHLPIILLRYGIHEAAGVFLTF